MELNSNLQEIVEHHVHVDREGVIHKCYHQCRRLMTDPSFWVGLTIGFPFEHLLWEKVWPFKLLTALMGL